jgi:hypothetical protein
MSAPRYRVALMLWRPEKAIVRLCHARSLGIVSGSIQANTLPSGEVLL